MHKKPIIILNAPAGCGKDTVARTFLDDSNVRIACFKQPMFKIASTILGMDEEEFIKAYEVHGWKDSHKLSGGKTVRDLFISISENTIKPNFGKDYFGEMLGLHIKKTEENAMQEFCWVITDGGFTEEVEALVEMHKDRVVIVQMYREGHTSFQGDSRNWITIAGVPTFTFDTSSGNDPLISTLYGLMM